MSLVKLKKRADFLRIAKSGLFAKTATMFVQLNVFTPDDNCNGEIRVGFTASRRVGNAVKRNFAKRRLKSIAFSQLNNKIKELLCDNLQAQGFEFVFIAMSSAATSDFTCIEKDFAKGVRFCIKSYKEKSAKIASNVG